MQNKGFSSSLSVTPCTQFEEKNDTMTVIEKVDRLNTSLTVNQWNHLIVGCYPHEGDQLLIDISGSSWGLKIWACLDTGGSSVE